MSWGTDAKIEPSMVDSKEEFDKYLLQRFPPDKKRGTSGVFMLSGLGLAVVHT